MRLNLFSFAMTLAKSVYVSLVLRWNCRTASKFARFGNVRVTLFRGFAMRALRFCVVLWRDGYAFIWFCEGSVTLLCGFVMGALHVCAVLWWERYPFARFCDEGVTHLRDFAMGAVHFLRGFMMRALRIHQFLRNFALVGNMMEQSDSIFAKISKILELRKNAHVWCNQTQFNNSKYPCLYTLICAPMCMSRVFFDQVRFLLKQVGFCMTLHICVVLWWARYAFNASKMSVRSFRRN